MLIYFVGAAVSTWRGEITWKHGRMQTPGGRVHVLSGLKMKTNAISRIQKKKTFVRRVTFCSSVSTSIRLTFIHLRQRFSTGGPWTTGGP